MPEFTESWAFWFLVGIVVGFILAIILAASGKASRIEERDIFRDDVPPYETPKEVAEKEKMRGIITTKNDPRTD